MERRCKQCRRPIAVDILDIFPVLCPLCDAKARATAASQPQQRPGYRPMRLTPLSPVLDRCDACQAELTLGRPRDPDETILCANCDRQARSTGWFSHPWQGGEYGGQVRAHTLCEDCQQPIQVNPHVRNDHNLCVNCTWKRVELERITTREHPTAPPVFSTPLPPLNAFDEMVGIDEDNEPVDPEEDQPTAPLGWLGSEWGRLKMLRAHWRATPGLWQRNEVRNSYGFGRHPSLNDVAQTLQRVMGDAQDKFWESWH